MVVNAAARTKASTTAYGDIMQAALQEIRRELTVFWVINRHRDSIELLHAFQQAFPGVPVHVCRNLYFGPSERFEMYNSSKARETIEKSGRTLDFPDVANRVTDWLYCPTQGGVKPPPLGGGFSVSFVVCGHEQLS